MRKVAVPAGGFRNVAVLRLSSLGDVVLTLPVVHALARAWPAATLHYWVKEEYAGVLRADPAIAHVRELERDASKLEDLVSMSAELEDCDLIVDLHGSARTRVLTFRQKAPVLRLRGRRLERERWVRARWTGPRPLPHATARYAEVVDISRRPEDFCSGRGAVSIPDMPAEALEFLERADEVSEGAPPAIQAPDDDGIDGPSACRLHEDLALPALMRTRTDLLNGEDNSATALCGIGRHGVPLEREGLLFLGRDTRIQP